MCLRPLGLSHYWPLGLGGVPTVLGIADRLLHAARSSDPARGDFDAPRDRHRRLPWLNAVRAKQYLQDSIPSALFGANIHFAAIGTDYFAKGQPPSRFSFLVPGGRGQFYFVWLLLFMLLPHHQRVVVVSALTISADPVLVRARSRG